MVSIHPFPNGNGRHSRIAADLLAVRLARPVFSWGRPASWMPAKPENSMSQRFKLPTQGK
ncbi:MAG: hypothetical protein ABIR77_07765 [Sphingomicrobium sp.]